jgi:hypothetical protein
MLYNTRDYWVSGICPSSRILNKINQIIPSACITVPLCACFTTTVYCMFSYWFFMMLSMQQSFNMLCRFYFLSHSLHVSAPTGHLQVRHTIRYFNGLFLIQRICCTYTISNSPLKYLIVSHLKMARRGRNM